MQGYGHGIVCVCVGVSLCVSASEYEQSLWGALKFYVWHDMTRLNI